MCRSAFDSMPKLAKMAPRGWVRFPRGLVRSALLATCAALIITTIGVKARAQACCAGAGAVTPGRLAIHEDALVGLQLKTANAFGSFSMGSKYIPSPAQTTEWEFEQAVFGALRVLPRGQLALLVPTIETYRRNPTQSSFGGGLGDINLSARYDFVLAGEALYIPGVAVLAGITFPTGKPIEASDDDAGTDATGVGAYQGNLGLAFEQTAGSWLFGVSGLVAKRTTRTVRQTTTSLAAQWTVLASAAYTFPNDAAAALIASYAVEGNPLINGVEQDVSRRVPLFGAAGIYPFSDTFRLQGGLFFSPPISQLGRNTPSNVELVLSLLRSWS
jgi:hypothetical protein